MKSLVITQLMPQKTGTGLQGINLVMMRAILFCNISIALYYKNERWLNPAFLLQFMILHPFLKLPKKCKRLDFSQPGSGQAGG
ncbi:hypothetical protein PN36_01380 [Candidatus Thiomargarita nelsonii]|uniref:Uncharacterized protein n=1 Tax=Candidatus Thiomargarita nelsonii TaxID=1003181 RepID=A0A0A6P2V4_9GAMM|nr:hypothetical protein PN36_01380 [Candidatus Thiomargarita nelsonii]